MGMGGSAWKEWIAEQEAAIFFSHGGEEVAPRLLPLSVCLLWNFGEGGGIRPPGDSTLPAAGRIVRFPQIVSNRRRRDQTSFFTAAMAAS
jgi:hypothetical protein